MAKEASAPPTAAPPETGHPPSRLEEILEQHWGKLLVGLLAVVAIVCGIFVLRYLSEQKEAEAGLAFTAAETAEELTEVSANHPGTVAAGNAHLRVADLKATEGEYQESLKELQKFLDTYEGHPRYHQGIFAMGAVWQQSGDSDQAQAAFQRLVDEFPDSDLTALAVIRLGDLAWSKGDIDKARDLFSSVPQRFPGSPFLNKVEERLRMLAAPEPSSPARQEQLRAAEEAAAAEQQKAGPDPNAPDPAPDDSPAPGEPSDAAPDDSPAPGEPSDEPAEPDQPAESVLPDDTDPSGSAPAEAP